MPAQQQALNVGGNFSSRMQRFPLKQCHTKMRQVTFLFIVLLFTSCSKNDLPKVDCSAKTNQINDVKRLIVGTYTWSYTKITYLGDSTYAESPLSTGLNYKYRFKPDGQVDYFQNDTIMWSNNYVVDYEFKVTTYPSDSATVVIITDKQTGLRQEFFRPYL